MSDISVESFEFFIAAGANGKFSFKINMEYNGEIACVEMQTQITDNSITAKLVMRAMGLSRSEIYKKIQNIDASTEDGKQAKELLEYLYEHFASGDKVEGICPKDTLPVIGTYGFQNITASLNGEEVEGITIEPWEEQ